MKNQQLPSRKILILLSMLIMLCGFSVTAHADSYMFTTIDYLGAKQTSAEGINDSGQVVGQYEDSNGVLHGFLYDGASASPWTTLDYLDLKDSNTQALSINNNGIITGDFDYNGGGGFKYDGVTWTLLQYPDTPPPGSIYNNTSADGINNTDKIIGDFLEWSPDTGYIDHGFLYDPTSPSTWTTIDYPGADDTNTEDINDADKIVGSFSGSSGVQYGFILDEGSFSQPLSYPGAVVTDFDGINNLDIIVGDATMGDGTEYGFVYDGETFFLLNIEGAIEVYPEEINNTNMIAGTYITIDGIAHGFIATPVPEPSPYDTDQNWAIDDFELLDAIDDWASGNLGDFDLLDLIDYWVAGCYQWDFPTEQYEAGCKSARGTYTYDPQTDELTLNITESNFQDCGPEVGTEIFNVSSITSTTMIWVDPVEGDQMTWERDGGMNGDIQGTWTMSDEGNVYLITFNQDGSFLLTASLDNCYSQPSGTFAIPDAAIIIDGNISDWAGIDPVFLDHVNDQDPEADFDGTDLQEFYLAKDDTFLYIMMTLYDGDPKFDTYTQYTFEANQNPKSSGIQGNYIARASYKNGAWSAAVDIRDVSTVAIYPPEYVGIGSKIIEWKVELSDMALIDGRYVIAYIHVFNGIFYPVSDYNATGIELIVN